MFIGVVENFSQALQLTLLYLGGRKPLRLFQFE
jgi:hypothetical protein